MNHPCQALADWRTLDELKIPTRAKFVLSWAYHPKAAAAGRAGGDGAHGRDARHGSRGAAAGRIRAACSKSWRRRACAAAAAGGSVTETSDRAAALERRERAVCQGVGHDHVLRRCGSGLAVARGPLRLVRARALVRRTPCPMPSSCTACRCAAMSRWPMKFSTARARWSSARPSTGWRCRWLFCIACWPEFSVDPVELLRSTF